MIRKITEKDKDVYFEMVRAFYSSEAVVHQIPEENLERTFAELMRSDVYAECFVFEIEEKVVGYALLAKTFSQEAGGMVCWLDELYVKPQYRSQGLGSAFFDYLDREVLPDKKRIRLEATVENQRAIALYERIGFRKLDYLQMYKGQ